MGRERKAEQDNQGAECNTRERNKKENNSENEIKTAEKDTGNVNQSPPAAVNPRWIPFI